MKNNIKVMHLVLGLKCGGLEKVVIDLADRLNSKGYQNVICCLDEPGELADEAIEKGIKLIKLERPEKGVNLSLFLKLSRLFRKEEIEVLHTHNCAPAIYGAPAAKLAGVSAIINTRHGREKKIVNRFIWNLNDNIIAVSEDAKKEFLKWNHVKEDRVEVIYNGININKYGGKEVIKDDIKMKLNIPSSVVVIGTIGRLSPEKDHHTLLKAFSIIVKSLENVNLVIVGDGILRKDLESYSLELGISEKVIFLGFREDIPDILSIFDLFVLPSETEGVSLTLLEAMAGSKPVVATDVGGNPEVVSNGETGLLVPPRDHERMAKAILHVLKDKELSDSMGGKGLERAVKHFSLDKTADSYGDIYKYWLRKKEVLK